MKVKAKIIIDYCSQHTKEIGKCDYATGDDPFISCDYYTKCGDMCAWYGEKTIYIDGDYKEVSTTIQKCEDIIVLTVGKKKYINDIVKEIEYLYIDDKLIVKDFQILKEDEEAE